jgi:tRNA-dihydrouridine synthase A
LRLVLEENAVKIQSYRLSVAPMMDWTDRHCRAFHRVITRRTLLYTEMAVAAAIVRGDTHRLIGFDPAEHPVALQIGGSDPAELTQATRLGAEAGYIEVNLNIGCPSDRVQSGRFGACLMYEPSLVAECAAAMQAAVDIPVTVKCRIGVDEQDPETSLFEFVETVSAAGITTFVVHARKAWLQGLSPKENRVVPPLDYDLVRRLKAARPDLTIVLNGGLEDVPQALESAAGLDGVMLGRAAYQNPWVLAQADTLAFGEPARPLTRAGVVEAYLPYIHTQLAKGVRLNAIARHMLGLFHGLPGAREWRRILSEESVREGAGIEVVRRALAAVEKDAEAA